MNKAYDFTSLSPKEFELLCRDLIQRKISTENQKSFFFNSFKEGKDGGIDAIFEDGKDYIVLQVKRYRKFEDLYNQIKNQELDKLKHLSPKRYILATSLQVSKGQLLKLYDLLRPYVLSTDDIIAAEMLNNLLGIYPEIELKHAKLYLPNTSVLERLLHPGVYEQSQYKLQEYVELKKYYVQDDAYIPAIEILNKYRFVIISGAPGVGKSTLAGMLSLYFQQEGYEFYFIRGSLKEISGLWKPDIPQLFLFDDFLGSVTFHGFDRNEDRELLEFVSKISRSGNKRLIVTSREYIFQQAELKYPELKELNYLKCIIKQAAFTKTFKIKILYNYLYHPPIELHHITSITQEANYESIIFHRNFTPRLISEYIKKYYDPKGNRTSLLSGLISYLDDPYAYWENIYRKLGESAKFILLIIAISEEPIPEPTVFKMFKNANEYRHLAPNGHEKDFFSDGLKEVIGSFVSVVQNPELKTREDYYKVDISMIYETIKTERLLILNNPSIKDFCLEFLRHRDDLIELLIQTAVTFNQLFLVFTTEEGEGFYDALDMDYYDHSHFLDKIHLNSRHFEVLKQKVLTEFDELKTFRISTVNWSGGDTTYHLNFSLFQNRMYKLVKLVYYFNLDDDMEIREFVIQKYDEYINGEDLMQKAHSILHPLTSAERVSQLDVLDKILPYRPINPAQAIEDYYDNISFTTEYLSWTYFKEKFPTEWDHFVTPRIRAIRKEIQEMILDDIDYFLWDGSYQSRVDMDDLLDIRLDDLVDFFKIRITKKLQTDINDMTGREIFSRHGHEQAIEKDSHSQAENAAEIGSDKEMQEQEYHSYKISLKQLNPDWNDIENDAHAKKVLAQYIDAKTVRKLNKLIDSSHPIVRHFLSSTTQIELLASLTSQIDIAKHSSSEMCQQMLSCLKLESEIISLLSKIACAFQLSQVRIFRKETFLSHFHEYSTEQANNIFERLINIKLLTQRDIWYTFTLDLLTDFLAFQYFNCQPTNKKEELYKNLLTSFKSQTIIELRSFHIDLYHKDTPSFIKHFLCPIIQEVIDILDKTDNTATILSYIKYTNLAIEFSYYDKSGTYDIYASSSADNLEPILRDLDIEIVCNDLTIEKYLNISTNQSQYLRKYIQTNFPDFKVGYTIHFQKELSKTGFIELLLELGMHKAIRRYIKDLKKFVSDHY
ncbi:restriction endonuclease [Chitinophaga varians]|uniref:nSTAND3 domain-containing NTPase n=1 Tax=Chitinophaga varians TaxID=2202339 RepID=UPI00165EE714|nr:restriction endonuclease [Chitinophaga varians]MBC9909163.1 restriction endonuclease [Chitinophaga varians]